MYTMEKYSFLVADPDDMIPFIEDFIIRMRKKPDVDVISILYDNPHCAIHLKTGETIPCLAVAGTIYNDWYAMTTVGKEKFYSRDEVA